MAYIDTIDVLSLPTTDKVQTGDTLLLIRPKADGTQECYRVEVRTSEARTLMTWPRREDILAREANGRSR